MKKNKKIVCLTPSGLIRLKVRIVELEEELARLKQICESAPVIASLKRVKAEVNAN